MPYYDEKGNVILGNVKAELTGSKATKETVVDAQAITDTNYRETSPITMNGEKLELEVLNTLDQDVELYVEIDNRLILQKGVLASEKITLMSHSSSFVMKYDGTDYRVLRLSYIGDIVLRYKAPTAPTSGSLTIKTIKKASV